MGHQTSPHHQVLVLGKVQMIGCRNIDLLLIPSISVHNLRQYTGICVRAGEQGAEGGQLQNNYECCQKLRMEISEEEIVGDENGGCFNDQKSEEQRIDR